MKCLIKKPDKTIKYAKINSILLRMYGKTGFKGQKDSLSS
jgi:hypothetical protein